ncbi:helix-turn-helix domain-containing protein [Streptomyces sp. NPDC060223]|uniref:helix-turn-helix domain-containing protein n=1 Tax=unclassified Streptomyces TaxID=2593676 RepID=UPI003640E812
MRELAGRLAELDPDAGAALQAIAYFDRLMEGRVGLEALVRGAAVLSGHPARLVDERRGVRIRVEPDGRRADAGGPVDPAWPWVPLDASAVARPSAAPDTPGAAPSPGSLDATEDSPARLPVDASGVGRPRGRAGASGAVSGAAVFDAADVVPEPVPVDVSGVGRPRGRTGASGAVSGAAVFDAADAVPESASVDVSGVGRPRGRTGASGAVSEAAALDAARGASARVPLDASGVGRQRGRVGTPEADSASLDTFRAAPPGVRVDTPRATPLGVPLDTSPAAQPSATASSPVAGTRVDMADVVVPEIVAALWLELPGPPDGVRAMILERAAGAVRAVLERTRGLARPAAPAPDPALVEVVLDASAPDATRTRAAAQLGLKRGQSVRAVALQGGGAEIVPAGRPGTEARRAGVGPAVEPAELPRSWAAARTALRLTAEGTAHDPGPRTVYADELGGLTLLAAAVGPDTPPIPDELALERALAEASWAASTLHAVASAPSLRAAATELTVHHSTLQERLVQAERILGWDVHCPQGRLRLQLVLAVRKLRRTGAAGQPTEGFSGAARQ